MSSKTRKTTRRQTVCTGQDGFSMIEVIIAILILTIALVATAAALTFALEFGAISKNVSTAKLIIVSSIEEIESLRNSRRLEFKQIENVGNVDNTNVANNFSGFSNDFQPVSINPGPDGVNGTPDDLTAPGADGTYGTNDDFSDDSLARTGYSRRITITNLPGSETIKKLEVRVRYFASAGKVGEIAGVAYINDEFRVTR